jgi:cytochrome oxidase Cu insertion factor (SCO1/SenC/PrrC family)
MKFRKLFFLRKSNNCFGLILFISLLSCTGKQDNQSSAVNEPENLVGKIELKDMNGHSIDLVQYRGKTVFINFWAT